MHGRRVGLTAVMCALALGGCELGDPVGGGPGGQETTVNLASTAALDGFAGGNGAIGTASTLTLTGDISSVTNNGFRQFFSFDVSGIPAGSSIVSATLRLHQTAVSGNPYTDLGDVVVDHMDYGLSLDPGDYAAAPLAANIGTLSTDDDFVYKQLAVASQVRADIMAPRVRSQFRLRFSTADYSNDGQSDFVQFADADASTNNPVLVVRYRAPVP